MKKPALYILIFLLAPICLLYSQSKNSNALLWKISGKGVKSPSYLFGTFHLLCSEDIHIPDTLHYIIKHSKKIFFEIKMDDPEMTKKIMSSISMKNGHQLKEFYSSSDYDSICNIFRNKTNIPLSFISGYKPYLLVPLLYPSMFSCNLVSLEKELQIIAEKDSVPIYGLETLEFQMKLFDSIPYKTQANLLKLNLFQYEKYKKELEQVIQMYRKKQIEDMQKTVESDPDFNKYETMLLQKRNNTWIPIILNEIATEPVFIAVGAGHLGGTGGLLSLLRKQGFSVVPVN
jgi:uncharacterized protein YbaP (TraB family)